MPLELATVRLPGPEMMSKNVLLEPRTNFKVAPESRTTLEGAARVPGRRPLDPPTPSWRVPVWTKVPPAQVAARLSRVRVPMPNLEREPGPETAGVPVKVWFQAPVSSEPP